MVFGCWAPEISSKTFVREPRRLLLLLLLPVPVVHASDKLQTLKHSATLANGSKLDKRGLLVVRQRNRQRRRRRRLGPRCGLPVAGTVFASAILPHLYSYQSCCYLVCLFNVIDIAATSAAEKGSANCKHRAMSCAC